mmetsp:Transcript_23978/g.57846  ORF Transcript_23978/g.57846 Transcript_23978/m.57846 type:complete len:293 (-) Transcript_23978:95-973(-)|eukprot:CAMPEP_0182798838 /NCGR_PEP_ID=MMETSP0006_2-20121128/1565_1 /TAXON_ID=97485 /ORGANISM="Prymnesium parvum, Strain Texoma1" /LENGTH=292 /DNA_ID=CAMNT_0024923985 /DNA_START=285 /DNA_END=1163 /DNA_ORIENTATION=+
MVECTHESSLSVEPAYILRTADIPKHREDGRSGYASHKAARKCAAKHQERRRESSYQQPFAAPAKVLGTISKRGHHDSGERHVAGVYGCRRWLDRLYSTREEDEEQKGICSHVQGDARTSSDHEAHVMPRPHAAKQLVHRGGGKVMRSRRHRQLLSRLDAKELRRHAPRGTEQRRHEERDEHLAPHLRVRPHPARAPVDEREGGGGEAELHRRTHRLAHHEAELVEARALVVSRHQPPREPMERSVGEPRRHGGGHWPQHSACRRLAAEEERDDGAKAHERRDLVERPVQGA